MSKMCYPSRERMIKLFKAFTPYDVESKSLNELTELFIKTFGEGFMERVKDE